MIISVLVVYPCDLMADWELGLAALASFRRVSYSMLLAPEKIQIQNKVSRECVSLLHWHKVGKKSSSEPSQGKACTDKVPVCV